MRFPQTSFVLGILQLSLALSAPLALAEDVPLAVTVQPESRTGIVGGSVSFSVSAVGQEPLSYQWWKVIPATGSEELLAGQTTRTLRLRNLPPAGHTGYRVTVSNPSGQVSSAVAWLQMRSFVGDAGALWKPFNHQELNLRSTRGITPGEVPAPPLFAGTKPRSWDAVAFWYQDFGLEATRVDPSNGDYAWYAWSWLFNDPVGSEAPRYQGKRHPWLGYYRGDDPNVLDWQCYWLNEAGVRGVILQPRKDLTNIPYQYDGASRAIVGWENPANVNHWIHNFLAPAKAPNCKKLGYSLWVHSSYSADLTEKAKVEKSFESVLDIYTRFPHPYSIVRDGKVFPVVYVMEGEGWRRAFDTFAVSTSEKTKAFLLRQAARFREKGFGGVAVFARHATGALVGDPALQAGGVLYYRAEYSEAGYDPYMNGNKPRDAAMLYADLANAVTRVGRGLAGSPAFNISNVVTDADAHPVHPSATPKTAGALSQFRFKGSRPDLFDLMLRNMGRRTLAAGGPRIFTVYNVSEWAEAGAALQPNMRDGKGYLNALRQFLQREDAVAPLSAGP